MPEKFGVRRWRLRDLLARFRRPSLELIEDPVESIEAVVIVGDWGEGFVCSHCGKNVFRGQLYHHTAMDGPFHERTFDGCGAIFVARAKKQGVAAADFANCWPGLPVVDVPEVPTK